MYFVSRGPLAVSDLTANDENSSYTIDGAAYRIASILDDDKKVQDVYLTHTIRGDFFCDDNCLDVIETAAADEGDWDISVSTRVSLIHYTSDYSLDSNCVSFLVEHVFHFEDNDR